MNGPNADGSGDAGHEKSNTLVAEFVEIVLEFLVLRFNFVPSQNIVCEFLDSLREGGINSFAVKSHTCGTHKFSLSLSLSLGDE